MFGAETANSRYNCIISHQQTEDKLDGSSFLA
jgi:hypothetical protein